MATTTYHHLAHGLTLKSAYMNPLTTYAKRVFFRRQESLVHYGRLCQFTFVFLIHYVVYCSAN